MPKPTTGRIDHSGPRTSGGADRASSQATPPPPAKRRRRRRTKMAAEDVARINDSAMTAIFAGVALFLGTMYFAAFAGIFGFLASRTGEVVGAQVGFGIGLAVGLIALALVMRWRQAALRARSQNLYRGIWIGALLALALIAMMAYVPHLAFPIYCQPGPGCGMIA